MIRVSTQLERVPTLADLGAGAVRSSIAGIRLAIFSGSRIVQLNHLVETDAARVYLPHTPGLGGSAFSRSG
jgi:hypothetical protein